RAERNLNAASASGRRSAWGGQIGLGYRHDSNANAAPDSPFVSVTDVFTGAPVRGQLPPEALERDDHVFDAWGRATHSFLFGNGSGNSWDTDASVFTSRYDELSTLDELGLSVDTGPTFVFDASARAVSRLRPFVTLGQYQLDGDDYIDATGI